MPALKLSWNLLLPGLLLLIFLARPAHAFGAGNIASTSKIENHNFRHGDIEDTLLTLLMARAPGGKKFRKMDVKRVYFGNWLRDYSQAVDVGTVKMVSAEAIRILLWILGFLSFGYGTKEFEVTTDRLGCYRPEEHIDNPKDYADNVDARQYDPRLRGPVDEPRELSINTQTGLKNYIASENLGIATSAGLVRNLFGRCIHLGRQYAHTKNKDDLYEALRLLGTGCHCLEDYSAHSNYTELALIELGERNIFPHVGRNTAVNLPGVQHPVWPIVTGTFGGVDFLHSVCGEFTDKVTQSEIQELEGTIANSQNQGNTSILRDILSKLPSGLFGGKDEAAAADQLQANAQAAQANQQNVSPKQPEAWARQLDQTARQIYPILEWHDDIMKSISNFIEKVPILPDLLEKLQDQINMFVFSLLAPFVLPIINQVKSELETGSSEVIESSKRKQLVVFYDDNSTDPTHSMLSKDHFSNILNEPAGKVASQVLKWVVPQVIECWDHERIDVDRTLSRIVNGAFHHPALRNHGEDGAADGRRLMFGVVQQWWSEKSDYDRQRTRDQLSRDGVQNGRNHEGQDTGHGSGRPLGMPTLATAQSSGATTGSGVSGMLGSLAQTFGGGSSDSSSPFGGHSHTTSNPLGNMATSALGDGALGGIVGGLAGALGGNLLGGAFGKEEKQDYQNQSYGPDGSYTHTYTETAAHHGGQHHHRRDEDRYGQAEYSQTSFPSGGGVEEYQRYEQQGPYGQQGYGYDERVETRPVTGGFERITDTTYEQPGGAWLRQERWERRDEGGEWRDEGNRYDQGSSGYPPAPGSWGGPPGGPPGPPGGPGGYGEPVYGQPPGPPGGWGEPPQPGYGEPGGYGGDNGYGPPQDDPQRRRWGEGGGGW